MTVSPDVKEVAARFGRRGLLTAGLLTALSGREAVLPPRAEATPNPLGDPRVRTAHLLRRAGFGASPAEVEQFTAMGYQAAVDWLLFYDDRPDAALEKLPTFSFDTTKREDLKRWWLLRMRYTDRPLQEKMTLFWHGLLTSGFGKVNSIQALEAQNELLRANALGNYQALLIGISKDPAMLHWLDGHNSRKRSPNENYGRELLELFSMGIGNYTEDDVKAAARAFTGWLVNKDYSAAEFRPREWDDGEKTFLGQTGRWDGNDIIDIICRQRATAEYISKRLFSFFAYRNPMPETVSRLADVFTHSGYNIRAVMREIFLSPEFSSAQAYRALVKSPVELVVGTLRTLGLDTDGEGLAYQTRIMGQDIFNPPNVAGWPGGAAWLNSATWLQRVNYANAVVVKRKGPEGTVLAMDSGAGSPAGLLQHYLGNLVDGQMDSERRTAIEAFARAGAPATLTPQFMNRQARHLVYLLMAGPEYQLA